MKLQNAIKSVIIYNLEIVNILMILISLHITRIHVIDIRSSSSSPQTRKFDEQTKR